MKYFSRCLASVLALTLCLLAGCVTVPDTTTQDTTSAGKRPSVPILGNVNTSEPADTSNSDSIRYLPEETKDLLSATKRPGAPTLWIC